MESLMYHLPQYLLLLVQRAHAKRKAAHILVLLAVDYLICYFKEISNYEETLVDAPRLLHGLHISNML